MCSALSTSAVARTVTCVPVCAAAVQLRRFGARQQQGSRQSAASSPKVNAQFTIHATPPTIPAGTSRWHRLTLVSRLRPPAPFAKGALLPPRGAKNPSDFAPR